MSVNNASPTKKFKEIEKVHYETMLTAVNTYNDCIKQQEEYSEMKMMSARLSQDPLISHLKNLPVRENDIYREHCDRENRMLQQKAETYRNEKFRWEATRSTMAKCLEQVNSLRRNKKPTKMEELQMKENQLKSTSPLRSQMNKSDLTDGNKTK